MRAVFGLGRITHAGLSGVAEEGRAQKAEEDRLAALEHAESAGRATREKEQRQRIMAQFDAQRAEAKKAEMKKKTKSEEKLSKTSKDQKEKQKQKRVLAGAVRIKQSDDSQLQTSVVPDLNMDAADDEADGADEADEADESNEAKEADAAIDQPASPSAVSPSSPTVITSSPVAVAGASSGSKTSSSYQLGQACFVAECYDDAITHFQSALQENPAHLDAVRFLALAHSRVKKWNEVVADVEKMRSLENAAGTAVRAKNEPPPLTLLHATALYKVDRLEEAIIHLKKHLAAHPKDPTALTLLAAAEKRVKAQSVPAPAVVKSKSSPAPPPVYGAASKASGTPHAAPPRRAAPRVTTSTTTTDSTSSCCCNCLLFLFCLPCWCLKMCCCAGEKKTNTVTVVG